MVRVEGHQLVCKRSIKHPLTERGPDARALEKPVKVEIGALNTVALERGERPDLEPARHRAEDAAGGIGVSSGAADILGSKEHTTSTYLLVSLWLQEIIPT